MYSRCGFGTNLSLKRSVTTINHLKPTKQKVPLASVTFENQFEFLSDVITPYWQLDYVQQLIAKKQWCRKIVEKIKSHKLPRSRTIIHDVVPSPKIESYRNKDEFSIRTGIDGNEKTVGFFLSSPAQEETICVPATKLISLKEEHIRLAEIFQEFIRKSELRASHDLGDGGFWRNLVVRSNRQGDLMAVVVVHPSGVSGEQLQETKALIKKHFLDRCPSIYSLYFQACPHVRCTGEQAPFVLLHGQEYLYETLNGLTVRISPDSFFQINTEAAVSLYQTALGLMKVDGRSTLLDLCCGIGCCSLIASELVRGCIGIEYVGHAIEDAKFNADFNGITNCQFIAGRIEKELFSVLMDLDAASDVVPFLNPGRAGVNRQVIRLLRRNPSIQRLAYIACKADGPGTMKNLVDLCSPNFDYSPPFLLTDVQAVDMFPQSPHSELILLFQR